MKFLVNAQLPYRTVDWLRSAGHDAIHTLDLPDQNRTTDWQLIEIADREDRVIVTKDADIVDSHLLLGKPAKLMLISLGNSRNAQLEAVLVPLIPIIATAFSADTFLEIGLTGVVVRG